MIFTVTVVKKGPHHFFMKPTERNTMPITLAHRTNTFQESVIREMTRLGDECSAVNLSQGLPDLEPPQAVLETALEAIRGGDNQYTFPFGSAEFRSALSRKYAAYNGIQADPETDITVTCGVSEAIMAAILALTMPGDEVIIFEPWYENYVPDCLMAGVTPRFVSLHEPEYTFDLCKLRSAFNNHTRLVIINTPHNPTGRVFSRSELEQIAALCQEYGVIAVTDEIYEHILFEGRRHTSIGSLDGMQDRTVTIGGLGKSYAVTGWRVGWSVACAALSLPIRKVHDYLTVCAPAPFQTAGITALDLPETYYIKMREKYLSGRTILLEALAAAGFTFHQPEGAYFVMADFANLNWDQNKYHRPGWSLDRNFAEYIARDIGVAIVPGSSFYIGKGQGNTRVRFNFAKKEETMREAARRLLRFQS